MIAELRSCFPLMQKNKVGGGGEKDGQNRAFT